MANYKDEMLCAQDDVEVARTFAYPSVALMLTVLGAFSPGLTRTYPAPHLLPAGERRDPESRKYQAWTRMEFQIGRTPRAKTRTTLQAPQHILAEDTEQLSRGIARLLGPAGMKHLHGMLIALDENFHDGWFTFDTDEHLDRLGYQRREQDGHFYHHPANVRKARGIARMFTSLTLDITSESDQDKRVVIKLFAEWGREETYCSEKCAWDDKEAPELKDVREPIQERKIIGANPIWYSGVLQDSSDKDGAGRQYTRQLKSLATEDPRTHGITLILGGLLPIKWRMNRCRPIRVSTANLMEWAGLDPTDRHRAEMLRKLHDELDYMMGRGYIGEWETEPRGEQMEDIVVIMAPDWLGDRLLGIWEAKVTKIISSTPNPPEEDEMDGKKLKRLREEAGLSVREFARQLGIAASAVSMAENGKRPITETMAEKVSEWAEERAAVFTNLDIGSDGLDIGSDETPGFWTLEATGSEHAVS